MDIGKRLRELREAKGLSQHDVEGLSGLSRSYISKTENGHGTPTLQVLERWASALDVGLHQVFALAEAQVEGLPSPQGAPVGAQERALLGLFRQMPVEDRSLLMSMARDLVKRKQQRD